MAPAGACAGVDCLHNGLCIENTEPPPVVHGPGLGYRCLCVKYFDADPQTGLCSVIVPDTESTSPTTTPLTTPTTTAAPPAASDGGDDATVAVLAVFVVLLVPPLLRPPFPRAPLTAAGRIQLGVLGTIAYFMFFRNPLDHWKPAPSQAAPPSPPQELQLHRAGTFEYRNPIASDGERRRVARA